MKAVASKLGRTKEDVMNKRALLEGNVYKALIQFAIPFLLANLLKSDRSHVVL